MANILLSKLASAELTDEMYANALASFFSDKTEYAQARIGELAELLTMSDEQFTTHMSSMPQSVKDKLVPYFPEDSSVEASMHRFEDLVLVYTGRVSSDATLTADMAEKMANDLASSTASLLAGTIGLRELCNKVVVNSAEVIGAIEAQIGSVSDEMLGTLSVLGPILSSESMCLRDKLKNILHSFGISSTAIQGYSGFGAVPCALRESVGTDGFTAFMGAVGNTIVNAVGYVTTVVSKVAGFVDRVFGGLLSRGARSLQNVGSIITGATDAVETRDSGDYTDFTCDNADFGFILYPSQLNQVDAAFLLSKLSHEFAIHLSMGFGTVDLWWNSSEHQWINGVIHWKPCNWEYAIRYLTDHAAIPDYGTVEYWIQNSTRWSELYTDVLNWGAEFDTEEEVGFYLDHISNILTSTPTSGLAGVSDKSMYYGIAMTQLLFFASSGRALGINDPVADATDYVSGFHFGVQDVPGTVHPSSLQIQNVDIALMSACSTESNFGGAFILSRTLYGNNNSFVLLFEQLVTQISTMLSSFDFDNPLNMGYFLPYIYISSFCTGVYHIRSDNELLNVMKNVLTFVGLAIVAIISVKLLLKAKKVLWVRQTSLDYKTFEADIASDGARATSLYKESVRLSRAQTLLAAVVGSAKTAAIKAWSALTGIVNGIAGRISNLVSSGSQTSSSTPVSLQDISSDINGVAGDSSRIIELISGH